VQFIGEVEEESHGRAREQNITNQEGPKLLFDALGTSSEPRVVRILKRIRTTGCATEWLVGSGKELADSIWSKAVMNVMMTGNLSGELHETETCTVVTVCRRLAFRLFTDLLRA